MTNQADSNMTFFHTIIFLFGVNNLFIQPVLPQLSICEKHLDFSCIYLHVSKLGSDMICISHLSCFACHCRSNLHLKCFLFTDFKMVTFDENLRKVMFTKIL